MGETWSSAPILCQGAAERQADAYQLGARRVRLPVLATIRITTDIAAPPPLCFDLARSVDAHIESTRGTGERAVAGVTTGLLALGDEVTWRARHLGVSQRLTSRITAFDRPRHFRDEMIQGVFRRIVDDHHFEKIPAGTRMVDVFEFSAPLGWIGVLAERLFLKTYMTRLLQKRAQVLKRLAESEIRPARS